MSEAVKNKGWSVAMAGIGINLALGILYAWSIFKGAIAESIKAGGEGAFAWACKVERSVCDVLSRICLCNDSSRKVQDKFGPKVTAMMGGVLVGSALSGFHKPRIMLHGF